MQRELIHSAAGLFPTFEHWQSFLELSDSREAIWNSWFISATSRIRQHFEETLPAEWDCEAWGDTSRDTRWFLREFGSESLGVAYSYQYRLDLILHDKQRFNTDSISRLLRESNCRPIQLAFERIDYRSVWGSELIEKGNFKFGTAHDGSFLERDLAWHAAHNEDAFVEQAIAKIERFTKRAEVTEVLRRLNRVALDESQAAKE